METNKSIKEYSYAIYGLGLSGESALKFLKKKKIKRIYTWDDKKKNFLKNLNSFKKALNKVDFIVISPGINIQKTRFKSILVKNKKKIITDLDLFYMQKLPVKSIMVTGTNGKSTTCKLIQHVLRKNKIDAQLGGNFGKPVLDLKVKKNSVVIIEASSFQLSYLKFSKPSFAIILNITKDHLDWHGTIQKYQDAKYNIFSNQDHLDQALLGNKDNIKKFKSKFFKSELIKVNVNSIEKNIKKNITNKYLLSKPNLENVSFVYKLSTILKIKRNVILKALNTFKGLPHRNELFFRKHGFIFINDSKATSFGATKYVLKNYKNIFWIVGGLPKLNDKIKLKNVKKNIVKAYIIGKNINFFKKQIEKILKYKSSYTIENALKEIMKDLLLLKKKKAVILLSPASASYDQFKNFIDRGNHFKKNTLKYARKFL
ncbi:UDP-N-acetylmuramoyl-L-alanine--D-glutamate ligase [Pelagibacteraceae bacterium]|nr:UDP-N-acetylmuramoyl-L-alanine--D-glutamate ligase [Pelagibacteraceae bacterium]